jgi:glycosyltransferase involved in cell wall biosynthesis
MRNSDKKVSIALCTYNGERFLQEQLESIAAQSVVPFELVICDDVSSDSTRKILENFAASTNFPVKVHFNTENLGFIKNFEKAISLCTGEIIFLSDQDDKWRQDKLEIMLQPFADPDVGLVFSNAKIIDEQNNIIGDSHWQAAFFTPDLQQKFRHGEAYKTLYLKTIVSGCNMAFRSKWWPLIQPFPDDILFLHDAWIALFASLFAEVVAIDKPLIGYRIHANQSTAIDRQKVSAQEHIAKARSGEKSQQYQKHLNQMNAIRERVQNLEAEIPQEKRQYLLQCIHEHERHLTMRLDVSRNALARSRKVLRELATGRYHRFSNGFKSALGDLLRKP